MHAGRDISAQIVLNTLVEGDRREPHKIKAEFKRLLPDAITWRGFVHAILATATIGRDSLIGQP